jgi:hypothetical protein
MRQPITVIASVVFDGQALGAIEKIRTANKMALSVMDRRLNFWQWETGEQEEHPQPRLHWGLGLRFGQADNAPKPGNALGFRVLADIGLQLGGADKPCMKEHVHGDDSFSQWISASEVGRCAEWRRGR